MFSKHDQIRGYDDELLAAMDAEEARQEDHLELIASENYTSKRVMQAQGSGLTNKYAEGYPGKRYYGGCEHVDKVIRNAKAMAEVFIGRGYDVVSGGTDNHLMLISLVRQGLTGKEADAALGRVGITVNKNAVPNDPQSPFVTSGIRIGTPAITTRGLQEAQSRELAGWICDILDHLGDADVEAKVATQVAGLCADFPVYR
ncbi:hypothetical protein [Pseudomonas aeruginosa]|uniref:hypothetical protein n=1 Tax=Pseudomonas aeruginosa TaxID=287 RepID=UPI001F0E81DF|nr:hypothetical protein [Pseudomonas aeruginosa]